MNLKKSLFSIFNKQRREMDYIKGCFKGIVQYEIRSFKDIEDKDKRDTFQI